MHAGIIPWIPRRSSSRPLMHWHPDTKCTRHADACLYAKAVVRNSPLDRLIQKIYNHGAPSTTADMTGLDEDSPDLGALTAFLSS
jgi:hypothetical protein